METHQNDNQMQERTHPVEENFLRKEITKALRNVGMPAHVIGWEYTRQAIFIGVTNPDSLRYITSILYPQVAEAFQTKPSRVERAIRHAVELSWDRGDLDVLNALFGNSISRSRGKPTNKEFLSALVDHLRLELQLC